MLTTRRTVLTALFVISLASAPTASAAAAPAPACNSAVHREFDFWLGNWTVTDWKTQKPSGRNNVTSELGGCALQEHWTDVDGSRGSSFTAYDGQRKVWHQTWVDDRGGVLLLDGGLVHGSMVLSGTGVSRAGKPYRQRITWTQLPGGGVRQHWEVSSGAAWRDVFDGRYRKS